MAKQPKQSSAPVQAPPPNTAAPAPKKVAAAPAEAAAPAAPKVKKVFGKPSGENDIYVRVYENGKAVTPKDATGAEIKLAPQANVIINAIDASDDHRITRKALVEILPKAGLVTRQPPERILSYYVKTITGSGAVKIIKTAEQAPATATPKAAKATKAEVPTAPAVEDENDENEAEADE